MALWIKIVMGILAVNVVFVIIRLMVWFDSLSDEERERMGVRL